MSFMLGNLEKVRALAVSGRLVAVAGVRAGETSSVTLFDYVADRLQKSAELPAQVLALAGDDAGFVAAASNGALLELSQAGAVKRETPAHNGAVTAVTLQGDLLASVGQDGFLRLWSRKSGAARKGLPELQVSAQALRAVAVSPAGDAVAAAGDDGVVRVVSLEDGAVREMPGHEGAVLSLAFTKLDGRLVSGGEDGTVRLWYLVGEVEADVRGKDESGHIGGTSAIAFLPTKGREQEGERFVTAGRDGKLRFWRTDERRKPRTLETRGNEPLHAALVVPFERSGTLSRLYVGGDARSVGFFALDTAGQAEERRSDLGHGFELLATDLKAQLLSKRESTVQTLAGLAEPEAHALLLQALAQDPKPEVRALCAQKLATSDRSATRVALTARLDDQHPSVRVAAFEALRAQASAAPLSALRAALGSSFADVRTLALAALPSLHASSPLVHSWICEHLSDVDASVRRSAIVALLALEPKDPRAALRTAFERGQADVRAEVLVRGALAKLLQDESFKPLVGKALDDADEQVRRVAFVINAAARPALLSWLEAKDEAFQRMLSDVLRRIVELEGGTLRAPGTDEATATVVSITSSFMQLTHPTLGDVSIFKPNLHTPVEPGSKVRLVGISGKRALDYVGLSTATVNPADVRDRLAPGTGAAPNADDREPLLAALACRTPDTALRGARGLAWFGDARALGALLTISQDPAPALRLEAAYALLALRDQRSERRLAWMMSDADAKVRDAAWTCYGALQSDPLVLATASLQSAHQDLRVRGLELLVKRGAGDARAEALLEAALDDEAPSVRAEAFRTLWAWHTKEPFSPLDRALGARFPDLRKRAVHELEAIVKHKEGGLEGAASERLLKAVGDRDGATARAAYDALLELRGPQDDATLLAALGSSVAELRAKGAQDAAKGSLSALRGALSKLLEDGESSVRIAAIESLAALVGDELGPVAVGLQSSHLDLRVRAAELLSMRRDERIIDPMQALIADKELFERLPQLIPLRRRAGAALANLGSPRLLRYFGAQLILDEDGALREQAARGVSNASRSGEEGFLLDLLGHSDLAVRSWAGEGLARLGDARALPVLTGTLLHSHPPIRIGAVLSFAALGVEGYSGILQGLEDPSLEVQRIVLCVLLARDLHAYRKGEAPELLTTALSSQRPEVRYAVARALELRSEPERYSAHLVELLLPERPEKAEELAKWPNENARAWLMVGLCEAIAGDRPEQRYAAAQALRLRDRPEAFFREVQRVVSPRATRSPWVPETAPEGAPIAEEPATRGPLGLLRRIFTRGTSEPNAKQEEQPAPAPVSGEEQLRLRLLAFGAYLGLLRQSGGEEEGPRIRRDAIERIVELVKLGAVTAESATPALARALDDSHHTVRKSALAALRSTHAERTQVLALALGSSAADVVRAALDELVALGDAGRAQIVKALDSQVVEARRYAFSLLEKTAAPGSLEPLLAALGSAHSDLRIGVLERLSSSNDPRVNDALVSALASDHEDLRLRAAELLASRSNDQATPVLGAALRGGDTAASTRARDGLVRLSSPSAVAQLSSRYDELESPAERAQLIAALAQVWPKSAGASSALEAALLRLSDDESSVRAAALNAALQLIGPRSDLKRLLPGAPGYTGPQAETQQEFALRFCNAAVKSHHAEVRLEAAKRLSDLVDPSADATLTKLFADRNVEVRAAAVAAYASRVEKKSADAAPLAAVIRAGARETMLAAALGLANKAQPDGSLALRPLLLFVRAGEEGERERAILGLGALGDVRALDELELIAGGGTEEAPVEESMQAAAVEALGFIHRHVRDPDVQERLRDRVESMLVAKVPGLVLAGLRSLRGLGDERSRARLRAALTSEQPDERRVACELLAQLKDGAAESTLAAVLRDPYAHVRWAAREALETIFPNERTRVELHAVESPWTDISEPAAAFLSQQGEPAELLAKLATIENPLLRERLRYGLARRPSLPHAQLAQLLQNGSAAARAEASWVSGVTELASPGARDEIGRALVAAVRSGSQQRKHALKFKNETEVRHELEVEQRGLWAARRAQAPDLTKLATSLLSDREEPSAVRVEAARSLGASDVEALRAALEDPDLNVRGEAASALGQAKQAAGRTEGSTFDPVMLKRSLFKAGPLTAGEDRRLMVPWLLAKRSLEPLLAAAFDAKNQGRLESIAALGLSTDQASLDALTRLASKDAREPEPVRKAAFRALRRAQRRRAQEQRS